jgi:CHASE3 domain sensor protein
MSLVAVAILAVLSLALSGWLARTDLEQARAVDRLGDQARSMHVGGDRVLSTLVDAETGQRGYLLTGDASYLRPYETAPTGSTTSRASPTRKWSSLARP